MSINVCKWEAAVVEPLLSSGCRFIMETALVSINHVINPSLFMKVKCCFLVQCGTHEGVFTVITVIEVWAAAGPPDFSSRTPTTDGWGWNRQRFCFVGSASSDTKVDLWLMVLEHDIKAELVFLQRRPLQLPLHFVQRLLVAMLLRTYEELECSVCHELETWLNFVRLGWWFWTGNNGGPTSFSQQHDFKPLSLKQGGSGSLFNSLWYDPAGDWTQHQQQQHCDRNRNTGHNFTVQSTLRSSQQFFWLTGLSSSLRSVVFFLKNGLVTN